MTTYNPLHKILDKEECPLEEIKTCLEQYSSYVHGLDSRGETPLIRILNASYNVPCEVVRLFLHHGAKVNSRNVDGSTPVMIVLKQYSKSTEWKKDVLQMLIEKGSHLNVLDKDGRSALCYALRNGNELCIIEMLLKAGCLLNACKKHTSPLHCAADLNSSGPEAEFRMFGRTLFDKTRPAKLRADVFEMLLMVLEKTPKSKNREYATLLQHVLQHTEYDAKVIELLLDRLQDVDLIKDEHKNTLLHLACHNEFCEASVFKLLIKQGVKVGAVNKQYDTALHLSLRHEWYSREPFLKHCVSIVRVLVESGSPVNVCNAFRDTPLSLAVKHLNQVDVLKWLFIGGARVGYLDGHYFIREFVRGSYYWSQQSEEKERDILGCLKMLVKCYFLENPDFDFQSLIENHKSYKSLSRFGADCLREVKALESKSVTLREFLYKYPSHELPAEIAEDFSPIAKRCFFNQLREIREENSCPILADIIQEKVLKLAAEILPNVEVSAINSLSGQGRVTLNHECNRHIIKFLKTDDNMLNFISAFNEIDCRVFTTEASTGMIFEEEEKNSNSEECPKIQGVLPPENEPHQESPPVGSIQSSSSISIPPGNKDGPLAFLRTQPQFQQMRQIIQKNPRLLNGVLQQIGQDYPRLLLLISQNQEEFVRMLSEPQSGGRSSSAAAVGGSGVSIPAGALQGSVPLETSLGEATVQVSPQDRDAIERASNNPKLFPSGPHCTSRLATLPSTSFKASDNPKHLPCGPLDTSDIGSEDYWTNFELRCKEVFKTFKGLARGPDGPPTSTPKTPTYSYTSMNRMLLLKKLYSKREEYEKIWKSIPFEADKPDRKRPFLDGAGTLDKKPKLDMQPESQQILQETKKFPKPMRIALLKSIQLVMSNGTGSGDRKSPVKNKKTRFMSAYYRLREIEKLYAGRRCSAALRQKLFKKIQMMKSAFKKE